LTKKNFNNLLWKRTKSENPKVLGVQAYIHVLRTKRDKKVVKGTLVGIYVRTKGYRCYILE
jgi:RecB family endonuclease NucS